MAEIGVAPRRTPARERGVALVLVLWAGALTSVIAAAFAFSVRTEVRLAGAAVDRVQAGALAAAGIERAILGLSNRSVAERWQGDGRRYEFELGGGRVQVVVHAETGRIDVNHASKDLLVGMLTAVGRARTDPQTTEGLSSGQTADEQSGVDPGHLADAIMDWRDTNDRRRLNGAEDPDYRAAGLPYGAGDRRFLSVSELRQVKGMTPETFAGLAPLATVYGIGPRVDAALAPRAVLEAIPELNSTALDDFLIRRKEILDESRAEGGDARLARRKIHVLARTLGRQAPRYLVASTAAVYTVTARGLLPSGVTAVRQAVVRISGSRTRPYQVHAWSTSAEFPSDSGELADSGVDTASNEPRSSPGSS